MTPKEDLVTIDKDQNLKDALTLMDKNRLSKLMVTEEGEIMGILTDGDIEERLGTGRERKLKTSRIHVSSAMTKDLKYWDAKPDEFHISPDMQKDLRYEKIRGMAESMLENNISSLPVREEGKVIGLVSETDLIETLRGSRKLVKEFYTRGCLTVNPNDTLVHARKIMHENNIGRLVVENRGYIAGIVTDKDVAEGLNIFRRALDKLHHPDIKALKVGDVMTPDPLIIDHEDTIGQAVEIMLENKISGLPVTGEHPGIITKKNLIRGIAYNLM
ncbi:MAG: CBS domain-containing protein [Candidatus Altiarchaeota archaeon]|nr:CBS domain-containing protein [Candidatus Altiarchaeota archaeon]